MEKKLSVDNLRISFKTSNGKVQAVRGISFDLYSGETLAIVGESGSGKSVTSRAIMGILAQNAIIESGKILYADKDLIRIPEEEFQKIRGDKIAMVFQDPLSSLNPIMRVGTQLTEAMLLKNKANKRESRRIFSIMLKELKQKMKSAGCENVDNDISKFIKFEMKHIKLEKEYASARAAALQVISITPNVILSMDNNILDNLKEDIEILLNQAEKSCSYFVVRDGAEELHNLIHIMRTQRGLNIAEKKKNIARIRDICEQAVNFPVPNTFTLGYYLTFVDSSIPDLDVHLLNDMTHKATEKGFMDEFLEKVKKAVIYSMNLTDKNRKTVSARLKECSEKFNGEMSFSEAKRVISVLKGEVLTCLDPLEIEKDSLTHTFGTSIDYAMDLYYKGAERNRKEERRFKHEKKRYDRLIAKGKIPDYQIIPASYIDLGTAKNELVETILDMAGHFENQLLSHSESAVNVEKKSLDIIDFLKEMAQSSVSVLTKNMAREKAINLMESVGIDNPRSRFRQYPFEFSGGMRQRIVIAIALTADPDILICDEPTTALDVTIQAQILDLINDLKKQRNLSVIFITHDLGVVANMADRVAVMYAGKIVEYGTSDEIFYNPKHPYTWMLLSSVPDLSTKEKLESIPGTPPNMIYPPKGDAFAERNRYALKIDFEEEPPMFRISDTHYAATWLLHPNAPKVEMPPVVAQRINKMKNLNSEKKDG